MKAILPYLLVFLAGSGPVLGSFQDSSKVNAARAQIASLNRAVEAYALQNNGEFPDELQQLLVKSDKGGPYVMREALLDPWERPYSYEKAGKKNDGERPDIWTVTPAKETLGNWQNKPAVNAVQLQYEVKIKEAQALVAALSKAVDTYALKHGKFPDTLQDLVKDSKVLANETLLDPWERQFQYDKSGPKNKGKRPDLWTTPPKSKEPIGNWQTATGDPLKALYESKVKLTRAQLATLTTAVKAYHVANQRYPNSLNELTEGKSPLIQEKALRDPWGNVYQYDPSGPHNEGKMPDIWTDSPQRERIGNWEKKETK